MLGNWNMEVPNMKKLIALTAAVAAVAGGATVNAFGSGAPDTLVDGRIDTVTSDMVAIIDPASVFCSSASDLKMGFILNLDLDPMSAEEYAIAFVVGSLAVQTPEPDENGRFMVYTPAAIELIADEIGACI